jgi:beta-lactamase class A
MQLGVRAQRLVGDAAAPADKRRPRVMKAARSAEVAMALGRVWKLALALAAAAAPMPASLHAQTSQTRTAAISPAEVTARHALEQRIAALGRGFPGIVGIAVRDVRSGWAASWNGERPLPQQSVSKFWVALTAFDAIDRGRLALDSRVTVRPQDLTLFHQPIRDRVLPNGFTTNVDDLITRALTQSDCTANDVVLWRVGGPPAVRAFLRRHGIDGVRFGPGERLMQSAIAGVTWDQSMSIGNRFEVARASVPIATRRRLFDAYVDNPVDGASALGVTLGLARLQRGELLSPASTQHLLGIMALARTGPLRLTGGLAPGWSILHKTGTGQELGSEQAGYNDVGIITSPLGRRYALAVLIGRTAVGNEVRMQLMQEVTRAAIRFDQDRR